MSDIYKDEDYFEIVSPEGLAYPEFPHPVPKAWVGTDLVPRGAKAKRKTKTVEVEEDVDRAGEVQQSAAVKRTDTKPGAKS